MKTSRNGLVAAWALLSACVLASCNGGSSTPPTSAAGPLNQSPKVEHGSGTCPCLYVTNWLGQSITVYPVNANGNAPPVQAIAGANTKIDLPYGVALDSSNNIYVTNFNDNSITVYPAGATGNVSPTAIIIGSRTQLLDPEGIAIDPINGDIYVQSLTGPSGDPSILAFAPGSNGNIAPLGVIEGSQTGLDDPIDMRLDSSANIYVTDANNYVDVYAAGATGNVAPTRRIEGKRTKLDGSFGLGLDSGSNIYVANNYDESISVYASGANGNVAPVQWIKGGKTKLTDLHDVAADSSGNVYASNGAGESRCSKDCFFIAVYAAGATGNVAPVRMIKGSKTGLEEPSTVVIH